MIKIGELMQMNKDTDRKFELGGGFTTDPKSFNFSSLSYFSVFKTIDIYRWLTETWPLGVDYARQEREVEGELQF